MHYLMINSINFYESYKWDIYDLLNKLNKGQTWKISKSRNTKKKVSSFLRTINKTFHHD